MWNGAVCALFHTAARAEKWTLKQVQGDEEGEPGVFFDG